MNTHLENLVVLQAQDLELARLRAELLDAPRRVRAAELALKAAETALATCRDRLAAEDKVRRGQESDIATQRGKVERLRRSLDGATSAVQVAAFEREIGFAETTISTLEDEELASMERTEALEGELGSREGQVGAAQAQTEAERARAVEVKRVDEAAVAGVEGERNALRPKVGEPWLSTYDRLTKAKGTAVAEAVGNATGGKCSACQMTVRPQRWQDLIGRDHQDEIFVCETCGRLLFWDPRKDAPQSWAAGERLNAARQTAGSGVPR